MATSTRGRQTVGVERFWSKVDYSGGTESCWPWKAARTYGGYGVFGKTRAHRVALEQSDPRPSDRHMALHRCDNAPCCNPRHLYWGTGKDNADDRIVAGLGHKQKISGDQMRELIREYDEIVSGGNQGRGTKYTSGRVGDLAKKYGYQPNHLSRTIRAARARIELQIHRDRWS